MVNFAAYNTTDRTLELQRLMLAKVQEKLESNIVVQLVKGSMVPYDIPKGPSAVPDPVKPKVDAPSIDVPGAESQEMQSKALNPDEQTGSNAVNNKEPQDPSTITKEQLQSPIDIRL